MSTLTLTQINDASTLDASAAYLARSLSLVPVPHAKKAPVAKAWQKLRLTEVDLPKYFTGECNIGFLAGEASNDQIDIDLDTAEAIRAAAVIFPPTATFGRLRAPRSHYIFHSPGVGKRKAWQAPGGQMLVEIRANGSQTLLPPSVHPSGERIAWASDQEPVEIEAQELHHLVTLVAVAALLAGEYPAKGSRQEFAMALGGALLQSALSLKDTEAVVRATAVAANDEEADKRTATVAATQAKIEAGERVTAMGKLREMLSPPTAKRLAHWLLGTPDERDDGRQLVPISGRHLRDQADDALNALLATNEPPRMFVRTGMLVRVLQDEDGQPTIDDLTTDSMRGLLARAANFMRLVGGGHWVPASPPADVVRDLLTLGAWPFPALVGLVETPTLRDDGSVLENVGYDPATRLIYRPHPDFHPLAVPADPSAADLERALELILNELLVDFRFRDQPSRANAVALLLTPFVRQAATGPAPLAVISAPLQGTGKS